jgi:hypothetical protein
LDRGIAHFRGHAAEELHGQRPVGGAGLDKLEGPAVFFEQRTGVDEVGGGPVESAKFAEGQPHGQVGIARQRREEEVRRKLVGTEAHWESKGKGGTREETVRKDSFP